MSQPSRKLVLARYLLPLNGPRGRPGKGRRARLPTLPDQITGVREALQGLGDASPEQVARHFKRGRAKTVEPLLETLAALGQARKLEDGRYAS